MKVMKIIIIIIIISLLQAMSVITGSDKGSQTIIPTEPIIVLFHFTRTSSIIC